MIRFLTLITLSTVYTHADFISKYEHGQKLYQNPRGISCDSCHGENGKGKTLATIHKNGSTVTITAPDITTVSADTLKSVLRRGRSVMPVYRLTDAEIEALYLFLNTREASR